MASRGIKTGRFWSGNYRPFISQGVDWGIKHPQLTQGEMRTFLKLVRPQMQPADVYPISGDCSSFAIALSNVLGPSNTEYVASFEDEYEYDRGLATHVGVKYNGRIYDAEGETTEQRLLNYAREEADDPQTAFVVTTSNESEITMHEDVNPDEVIGGSCDPRIISKIERIMQKVLKSGVRIGEQNRPGG